MDHTAYGDPPETTQASMPSTAPVAPDSSCIDTLVRLLQTGNTGAALAIAHALQAIVPLLMESRKTLWHGDVDTPLANAKKMCAVLGLTLPDDDTEDSSPT